MNDEMETRSSARPWRAIGVIAVVMVFGVGWTLRSANADIDNERATNVHEGDNDGETDQDGNADSGDAVVGQVAGAVSSGDTSIDATNLSEDSSAESGDVEGSNEINAVVANVVSESGCPEPATAPPTPGAVDCPDSEASDIDSEAARIVHEGDNELDAEQDLSLNSGDAVGGQVIGAVTAAGGSADIVAANTSRDVEAETGDAEGENDVNALAANLVVVDVECCPIPGLPGVADIDSATSTVVHEGDNEIDSSQDLDIATGDAVGGQVIGVVSSGDASVDATNLSEDVETTSGDAEGENDFAGVAGDIFISEVAGLPALADIDSASSTLVQEGDNEVDNSQEFDVVTGDTVAGQIIGVVAAGTVDVVSANTSVDSETESGESEGNNNNAAAAGLFSVDGLVVGGEGIKGIIPIF